MSGDNHRQPQSVESIREHRAQRLLAQPQPPNRSHEVDAHLYRLWIHLPRPQAGTSRKLTRVMQKHRPVLHAEAVLTFTFSVQPGTRLFSGHSAAEVVSHFRVAPQRFGKRGILVSPASKCQTSRRRRGHAQETPALWTTLSYLADYDPEVGFSVVMVTAVPAKRGYRKHPVSGKIL